MNTKRKYAAVKPGDIFTTNNAGQCVVQSVEGTGTSRSICTVQFIDTGYCRTVRVSELRNGTVRDPYAKTVLGIGYLGEGPYKNHEVSYNAWRSMLERCYGSRQVENYTLMTVDPVWHNYQVFAAWFNKHYKAGYQLDKDLKRSDSNSYGPDTCLYVPRAINYAEATLRSALNDAPELAIVYKTFVTTVIALYDA